MNKIFIIAILILMLPGFAVAATVTRGDRVITGDLYIGGSIKTVDDIEATKSTPSLFILPERTAPVNAVASAGKLTSSGALTPATHATNKITSDATNVASTKTVTINTTVYRFMDTPAQAYDINVGSSAAESLDFLKAAINATGTGDGSDYYEGTLVHPDVVATTNTDTTQIILARAPGVAVNDYATTETSDHLAWADSTIGGGTGDSNPGVTTATATFTINGRVYTFVDALSEDEAEAIVDQIVYGGSEAVALDNMLLAINAGDTAGTNYSTGTVINPDVTAGTNTATTQVITAKVKGVLGDLITITETLANTAWDDPKLGKEVAGVDGTIGVANETWADGTYLYHCLTTNTIADTNWRRVTFGSAY